MSADHPTPDPVPDAAPPDPAGHRAPPPDAPSSWSELGVTKPVDPARIRDLHQRMSGVTLPLAPVATVDPAPPVEPPPSPARRRRTAAVLLVALVALLLAASGLALLTRMAGDDDAEGRGSDAGGAEVETDEGGEIDLELDPPGTLPGFALGDEVGDGAPDTIVIDGEWFGRGQSPTPTPPAGPDLDPQPPSGGEVGEPQGPGDPSEPSEPSGGDDPTPPDGDPDPQPQPDDPCAGLQPGAHLVTTPDPAHLNPGVMASSLTIRNCGTDSVSWTAATKPSVTLASSSGTLTAGATQSLGFTIDQSKFATDAIAFTIKVSEPGFNQYVDIAATKMGLAQPQPPGPDFGDTLSDGGPTGCAAHCITSAVLTPNATTPTMDLAVEASVAARFSVYVSPHAPVDDPDGLPSFPEVGLIAATADLNTAWHAALEPLEPATDYHIIVRATDADGGISNRVGMFRTMSPAVDPDLGVASPGGDSGCATQCITRAWLTPDVSSYDMTLDVSTHTLARLEAFVSTDAPTIDQDGHPTFGDVAPMATNFAYEKEWHAALTPLEPGTRYTVIVKATDGMLRSSYQVGSFETRKGADQMMITLHKIRVSNDGDATGKGELSFSLVIDGTWAASTSERRIGSGTTVNVGDGDRSSGISRWVDYHDGPGSWLPGVEVLAFERDGDGINEFCSAGEVPAAGTGHDDDCDWKWNTAGSGLVPSLDAFAPCSDFGIDDELTGDRCVQIESTDEGDDVPRFSAVVSMRPFTS